MGTIWLITSSEWLSLLEFNFDKIIDNLNEVPAWWLMLWDELYEVLVTPNERGWPYLDLYLTYKPLTLAEESVVYSLDQRNTWYPIIAALNESWAIVWDVLAPYQEQISQAESKIEWLSDNSTKWLIKTLANNIPYFVSSFFIYIFLVSYLFTSWDKFRKQIIETIPLENEMVEEYLRRIGLALSALVKWVLLVSLIQWFLTWLAFWMVWVNQFMLIFLLATLLYMVGIWAGILSVPFGIYLLVKWKIVLGLLFLLINAVIWVIDNIVKPYLMHSDVRINSVVLMIATFSGVIFWWVAGIIYWPLLMTLALSTYKMIADKK